MSITTTCRCCQRALVFPEGTELLECSACFTLNARPQSEGPTLAVLQRATEQRLRCDFENAEKSYQHVLLDYPEEHEALWGLALCRYSVEYVEDPATGKRLPVVHGVRRKPMQLDSDFQQACELAPDAVRTQYEAEAEYIDNAMQKICELAENCPPFDVFICHKTTKPGSSDYTEDYNRAFKLYHLLDKAGYRAFFAPMEMEDVSAGSDYEAGIYHALDTAKVMLVVCSDAEYLTSAWVRNEWTRFLEMADVQAGKRLVPLLYGELPPAKLPRDFRIRKLQGVMMGEMGSAEKVLEAVRRYAGAGKAEVKPAPAPVVQMPSPAETKAAPTQKPTPAKPTVIYAPERDFETKEAEDGVVITKYTGNDSDVHIPPTIGGRKVVEIGNQAFQQCENITRVTIPDGVTSIGKWAFFSCYSLTSINIPASVTSIGKWAFFSCYSLKSVTIPNSVTSIGESAFSFCSSLTSLTIPDSVTSIEYFAFISCSSLTSLTIPTSVTNIGSSAFDNCPNLTLRVDRGSTAHSYAQKNNIPYELIEPAPKPQSAPAPKAAPKPVQKPTVIYAPESDFVTKEAEGGVVITRYTGNDNLLRIPQMIRGRRVVAIGDEAFRARLTLEEVALPADVTSIGVGSFRECANLRKISLPSGLTFIGSNAFQGCKNLLVIHLPEGLTEIAAYTFNACVSLKSVSLPGKVECIGESAFDYCTSLQSISLPAGLREIDSMAFYRCFALSQINLPDNVKLGKDVFGQCRQLPASIIRQSRTSFVSLIDKLLNN